LPDVDVSSLRAFLQHEHVKSSSWLSAGWARDRLREEEEAREPNDKLVHRLSRMSREELAEQLRPPLLLYDDGVLNGIGDLLLSLLHSPPTGWATVLWSSPCFLLAGELLVAAGAVYKFSVEWSEMREQGVESYFGSAGSAFFENTLSLTFSSLMFVVMALSLFGSPHARVVQGLASMVCWTYLLFFLLAFRMTGPMIVMIQAMLFSDVIRFLSVFGVFLVSFALSFFVLFQRDGFGGFVHSIQTCFLASLGDFELDEYAASPFPLVALHYSLLLSSSL
jgi:hypothetical protein